jgi:hypothetical protein
LNGALERCATAPMRETTNDCEKETCPFFLIACPDFLF